MTHEQDIQHIDVGHRGGVSGRDNHDAVEAEQEMKMADMPDEELRVISMRKGRNGCATAEALRAQQVLWERYRYPCGRPEQHADIITGNKKTVSGNRYGNKYD